MAGQCNRKLYVTDTHRLVNIIISNKCKLTYDSVLRNSKALDIASGCSKREGRIHQIESQPYHGI